MKTLKALISNVPFPDFCHTNLYSQRHHFDVAMFFIRLRVYHGVYGSMGLHHPLMAEENKSLCVFMMCLCT